MMPIAKICTICGAPPKKRCPCERRLATAHPDLQRVFRLAATRTHLKILVGHRNEVDQHAAFVNGFSRADWPNSPHNARPAQAVDAAPLKPDWTIDWKDVKAFAAMGDVIMTAAEELGVELRWGRDFKTIVDWPHFERAGWAAS